MVDKAYEIIDMIDDSNIKMRINKIKLMINNNEDTKMLIKKFYEAKNMYEKYNYKDEFIKAKLNMLKDPLIKEYVELQNKINLITLKINNRINKLTKDIADKK